MKIIEYFIHSAGVVLLALALVMFLGICVGLDYLHPHDPLVNLPLPLFFSLAIAAEITVALVCLFGRSTALQITSILWLASNVLVYRLGLAWLGVPGGFRAYLGDMAVALGLSIGMVNLALQGAFTYLAVGVIAALFWPRLYKERIADGRLILAVPTVIGCASCGKQVTLPDAHQGEPIPCPDCQSAINCGNSPIKENTPRVATHHIEALARTMKIHCPACGGHIQFPTSSFGEKIPCPHCQTSMILQKAKNYKMSCTACDGHIEFPDHALGQTIPCPHCKKDIALKYPK